eukprot:TRINITY_DN1211_c0_g1_i15.p1 TRINITY_DN1211_c0_g1~~TRINITY_DN1211_c0_g1_i15.p1  ORF type:complete len:683 (+),score=177.56 TRINITY_DN1211_c0_g1_i15:57-2105(+)
MMEVEEPLQTPPHTPSPSPSPAQVTPDASASSDAASPEPRDSPPERRASKKKKPEDPAASARLRLLTVVELCDTEKTHLQTLRYTVEAYLEPIRAQPLLLRGSAVRKIFHNVERVERVSELLCEALLSRVAVWSDSAGIADCFMPLLDKINSVYTSYMENYDKAIRKLFSCKQSNERFAAFLEEVKMRPASSLLDLESRLVTPVQRAPRYLLLLKEYLAHTPPTHSDYEPTTRVRAELEKMARTINESIKKQQNTEKLIELQKRIVNMPKEVRRTLMADHVLIREGPLLKDCRKMRKKRMFWLFSDCLMYGEQVGQSMYSYHRTLLLESAAVQSLADTPDTKNAFEIATSMKSFIVHAETPLLKEAWLVAFNQILNGKATVDEARAQQPSCDGTQKTRWIPDKEFEMCMVCGSKFTVINRRHHCRNCGKIVCSGCSKAKRVLAQRSETKPERVCTFCNDFLDIKSACTFKSTVALRRNTISFTSPGAAVHAAVSAAAAAPSAVPAPASPAPFNYCVPLSGNGNSAAAYATIRPRSMTQGQVRHARSTSVPEARATPPTYLEVNPPHYLVLMTPQHTLVVLQHPNVDPATVAVDELAPAAQRHVPTALTLFVTGRPWAPSVAPPAERYASLLARECPRPQLFSNSTSSTPVPTPLDITPGSRAGAGNVTSNGAFGVLVLCPKV